MVYPPMDELLEGFISLVCDLYDRDKISYMQNLFHISTTNDKYMILLIKINEIIFEMM